jgi:hypothetical protein
LRVALVSERWGQEQVRYFHAARIRDQRGATVHQPFDPKTARCWFTAGTANNRFQTAKLRDEAVAKNMKRLGASYDRGRAAKALANQPIRKAA